CSECGKILSNKYNLKMHMLIRTGEKPFKCPQCDKSFRDFSNRKAHLRLVHKIQPYSCLNCGEQFDRKLELNDHLCTNRGQADQEQ
ncbi:hypothetical protein PMAYCL1PPCAC_01164, partial [Pristionchus mayeri]